MPRTLREIALDLGGVPLRPDRGGYTVTMREDEGAEETVRTLAGLGGEPGLHVGWGSFRNLDLAAAARATHLLVCDLNAHQLAVWQAVAAAMERARFAEAFVDQLADTVPRTPPLRQFVPHTREWLRADLERTSSWLWRGDPGRYAHVRSLFERGDAGFGCLDVRGDFDPLASLLDEHARHTGVRLRTLYLSNLPYMLRRPEGFFGEPHGNDAPLRGMWHNLERIAAPGTWVIRAEQPASHSRPEDLHWRTECSPFPEAMRHSLGRVGIDREDPA